MNKTKKKKNPKIDRTRPRNSTFAVIEKVVPPSYILQKYHCFSKQRCAHWHDVDQRRTRSACPMNGQRYCESQSRLGCRSKWSRERNFTTRFPYSVQNARASYFPRTRNGPTVRSAEVVLYVDETSMTFHSRDVFAHLSVLSEAEFCATSYPRPSSADCSDWSNRVPRGEADARTYS